MDCLLMGFTWIYGNYMNLQRFNGFYESRIYEDLQQLTWINIEFTLICDCGIYRIYVDLHRFPWISMNLRGFARTCPKIYVSNGARICTPESNSYILTLKSFIKVPVL